MKIIIKTLKGVAFDLELEESNTVLETKQKIEEVKTAQGEEYKADTLKLISLGKIMEDDK
jgi:hypothetical protein